MYHKIQPPCLVFLACSRFKSNHRTGSGATLNNILNDMILPTITVKKKSKKKEEKRKKKKNLAGMKRAFNKLRPSLEVKNKKYTNLPKQMKKKQKTKKLKKYIKTLKKSKTKISTTKNLHCEGEAGCRGGDRQARLSNIILRLRSCR